MSVNKQDNTEIFLQIKDYLKNIMENVKKSFLARMLLGTFLL